MLEFISIAVGVLQTIAEVSLGTEGGGDDPEGVLVSQGVDDVGLVPSLVFEEVLVGILGLGVLDHGGVALLINGSRWWRVLHCGGGVRSFGLEHLNHWRLILLKLPPQMRWRRTSSPFEEEELISH